MRGFSQRGSLAPLLSWPAPGWPLRLEGAAANPGKRKPGPRRAPPGDHGVPGRGSARSVAASATIRGRTLLAMLVLISDKHPTLEAGARTGRGLRQPDPRYADVPAYPDGGLAAAGLGLEGDAVVEAGPGEAFDTEGRNLRGFIP